MKWFDKNCHPAKKWPTRWVFHDHSHRNFEYQIIDLLHDIRLFLFILVVVIMVT